jgi:hypothetical protein
MSVKSRFGLMAWVVLVGSGAAACSGAEMPSGDSAGSNQDDLRVVKVPKPPFCGGIAGIPCPDGQACIDDPSDDCDPKHGGADCGGICVDDSKPTFCGGFGGIACPKGQACIDDPSDDCDPKHGGADCGGICVAAGTPCGRASCGPGTFCCNPLVGMCAKPGGACTQ